MNNKYTSSLVYGFRSSYKFRDNKYEICISNDIDEPIYFCLAKRTS